MDAQDELFDLCHPPALADDLAQSAVPGYLVEFGLLLVLLLGRSNSNRTYFNNFDRVATDSLLKENLPFEKCYVKEYL